VIRALLDITLLAMKWLVSFFLKQSSRPQCCPCWTISLQILHVFFRQLPFHPPPRRMKSKWHLKLFRMLTVWMSIGKSQIRE